MSIFIISLILFQKSRMLVGFLWKSPKIGRIFLQTEVGLSKHTDVNVMSALNEQTYLADVSPR